MLVLVKPEVEPDKSWRKVRISVPLSDGSWESNDFVIFPKALGICFFFSVNYCL